MAGDELDQALQLRADGDLDAAATALGKIIDAEGPDEAEAWLWLAATYEDRDDPESAVSAYQEALRLDLGELHATAGLGLARALIATGNADDATAALDDTEPTDDEERELAKVLRHRVSRMTWVLRLGPGYLTRGEIAYALLGLLVVASTFLPWLSVHYRGYPFAEHSVTRTVWQFAIPVAVLVSCCALVLVVHLVRMTDRKRHRTWPVVADMVLSAAGTAGAVYGFFALRATMADPWTPFGDQYLNVYRAQQLPWFYVTCGLVLVHLVVSVGALVRMLRRGSTPTHLR